jgi:KaiC/GvpD/RAD55 family RecA-like ATPase
MGFIRHIPCNICGSSDAGSLYDDGGTFCFACEGKPENPDSGKNQIHTNQMNQKEQKETLDLSKILTQDELNDIESNTDFRGKEFRGISDSTLEFFGTRVYLNSEDEVESRLYPVHRGGNLEGFKIREVPKTFRSKGLVSKKSDLFGQEKFKGTPDKKYLLITEGEEDAMAAFQMLEEYRVNKNGTHVISVVSPVIGGNASAQIQENFNFINSYDYVILGLDSDAAGKSATDKMLKVLPKGKTKVMSMRLKDANEYLMQGKSQEFITDFYNAERIVPVGVLPSDRLYERILEQSKVFKMPFPPFMGRLNELLPGGLQLGHIVNIAAGTGIGKTSLVNEMVYHWVFNSPHLVGVVSMELDAGQYGEVILSRHVKRKIALFDNQEDKLSYLKSEDLRDKAKDLWVDQDGNPRFYLLDNRDGTVEEIQEVIQELVQGCGCKVIILDPLQDVLDGLSNEEQSLFMKWAKGFIKSHGISFVFINHMRKSDTVSENDVMGSSTITKSASINILLKRDKESECNITRNTTTITVPKNRIYGLTGHGGAIYYDNSTHTLHNLDDWLNNNKDSIPEDYVYDFK